MKHRLKKAQSTAEYAILISLVIAAAMGISAEVKKALMARIHNEAMALSNNQMYEPGIATKETTNQTQDRIKTENYVTAGSPNAVFQSTDDTSHAAYTATNIQ